jgi:hypothetical protein
MMKKSRLTFISRFTSVAVLLLLVMSVAGAVLGQGTGPGLSATLQPVAYFPFIANGASSAEKYDWLQFNGDPQHSGNNTKENTINAGNVTHLKHAFQVGLPDVVDGAPVYLGSVTTANGVEDMLFMTAKNGDILALDAHSGATIWSQSHPANGCKINNGGQTCYTTSSPVVDPNRQFVYSYGLDGYAHKHQVGDGTEITTGGWPELASLKPYDEKGSSALSYATAKSGITYLYVTNGGYPGDGGDYQGHVTAINLSNGDQKVFNTVCSNQTVHFSATTPDCAAVQTAIWARSGVVYDSRTDLIYMATGNGTFDPGSHYWGDTVFALHPDGTGVNGDPVDTYTPTNYLELQNNDIDIGSTAPVILPVPANSSVQHLALQSGKDSKLRLINLDNLSGQGAIGHTGGEVAATIDLHQGNEVLSAPAVWVNPQDQKTWVFIATDAGISGYQVAIAGNGAPSLSWIWQDNVHGFSPIVANGVLYYFDGQMRALDPLTGSLLWADTTYSGSFHWQSPVVVNGMLYVTDESSNLTAYSLQ